MKASELRIGNWIQINNYIDTVDTLSFSINSDHRLVNGYPSDKVEPIPLTEEWLEKFGFTAGNFYYYIDLFSEDEIMYFNLSTKEIELSLLSDEYVTPIPHIKYVHQLQNLYFALTGEELGIKK